jgi:hypothetical protein
VFGRQTKKCEAPDYAVAGLLLFLERIWICLLNRAANLREYIVGVGPDEPDGAHDDHQNHSQHDCVFSNVLTTVIVPEVQ